MTAHMIPPVPKDFDPASEEGMLFEALKNGLSSDYYVFHSVKVNDIQNKSIVEREVDFVIVNRDRGVLCLEAKNGSNIRYYDRDWHYSSGEIMDHDGPYYQVSSAKRALRNKMKKHSNEDVRNIWKHCKFYHAVWFFGMTRESFEFKNKTEGLPEEAILELTMFLEDLKKPEIAIKRIFGYEIKVPKLRDDTEFIVQHHLTDDELNILLDSVLCPEFNLIPSPHAIGESIEYQMNQLLREQYRLLDFLEEQDNAVINGAAGTGKTMIAVEKARRNSIDEENVLYLCYNRLLCNKLNNDNKKCQEKARKKQFANVEFMTIHELTQKVTGNYKDIDGLTNWLKDCIDEPEVFGYKHVIIDEGQDFGLFNEYANNSENSKDVATNNCSIIDLLQEVVAANEGTFYFFYDKYQMIQGGGNKHYLLPSCVENSDCRLSLHYNCRNTKEIAQTSVTPLKDEKNKAIRPKVASQWVKPVSPIMHIVTSEKKVVQALNDTLEKYKSDKINDVVILVQGSAEHSVIGDELSIGKGDNEGFYLYNYDGTEYRVSTCIKFKGLEAEAIIMIGLDKNSFVDQEGLEFYVGSSRARHFLEFIVEIVPNDYSDVISLLAPEAIFSKNKHDEMREIIGEVFSSEIMTS